MIILHPLIIINHQAINDFAVGLLASPAHE